MCDRCLADDILAIPMAESKYWFGAAIGTAIHAYAEDRLLNNPVLKAKYPDVRPECKMELGEIAGYGTVTSTSDLYFEKHKTVGDWKSISGKKYAAMRTACLVPPHDSDGYYVQSCRAKLLSYTNQLMLYGRGYENMGLEVELVAIIVVNRDALTDDDIFTHVMPYDRQRADILFDRADRLWQWLQDNPPEELDSDPDCWYCNVERTA